MKRILLWALLLAAPVMLGLLPLHGTDAGDLEPAQILLIDQTNGEVRIECDTGASGTGKTLEQALREMEETANRTLFLQTAQTLVFSRAALSLLPQAANSPSLRPAARVYAADGTLPDGKAAAEFLQTHAGGVTLGQVRAALLGAGDAVLPVLQNENGRMRLLEA